jgi:hypothetical protein
MYYCGKIHQFSYSKPYSRLCGMGILYNPNLLHKGILVGVFMKCWTLHMASLCIFFLQSKQVLNLASSEVWRLSPNVGEFLFLGIWPMSCSEWILQLKWCVVGNMFGVLILLFHWCCLKVLAQMGLSGQTLFANSDGTISVDGGLLTIQGQPVQLAGQVAANAYRWGFNLFFFQ